MLTRYRLSTLTEDNSDQQPSPDSELVQKALLDTRYFVLLYQRYVDRVYRYCLARVNHVDDAQDITSQTFLAALEGLRSFRNDGSFAAWLFGIAGRKAARIFRQQPTDPIDTISEIQHSIDSPEELVNQRLTLERVLSVIEQLSHDRREAIRLHYFAGLAPEEIGMVMGKSEEAIRMLIHRGMRDLKVRLYQGSKKGDK